jgi:hypothetical protein
MHAFAAATDRAIRFTDARNRLLNAKAQDQRPLKCFVCDGAHYIWECSWPATVRDMVKQARIEASSRTAAAAAAVAEGDGQLQQECEGDGYDNEPEYANAADAGDPYDGYASYEDADWLHNVAT